MRFNPFKWNEVIPNEKTDFKKGWLRVRASAPAALYIQAEGVETLVSYGSSWDVQLSQDGAFFVDAPETVRVFVEQPFATTCDPCPEVYTNIDRMVQESGSVLEVRKALRELELKKREILRVVQASRPKPVPAPAAPVAAPDPAPVKEETSE